MKKKTIQLKYHPRRFIEWRNAHDPLWGFRICHKGLAEFFDVSPVSQGVELVFTTQRPTDDENYYILQYDHIEERYKMCPDTTEMSPYYRYGLSAWISTVEYFLRSRFGKKTPVYVYMNKEA